MLSLDMLKLCVANGADLYNGGTVLDTPFNMLCKNSDKIGFNPKTFVNDTQTPNYDKIIKKKYRVKNIDEIREDKLNSLLK
jgi:hypothetical protein